MRRTAKPLAKPASAINWSDPPHAHNRQRPMYGTTALHSDACRQTRARYFAASELSYRNAGDDPDAPCIDNRPVETPAELSLHVHASSASF
jgi:hypothetical protein